MSIPEKLLDKELFTDLKSRLKEVCGKLAAEALEQLTEESYYPVLILKRKADTRELYSEREDTSDLQSLPKAELLTRGYRKIGKRVISLDSNENLGYEIKKIESGRNFIPSQTASTILGISADMEPVELQKQLDAYNKVLAGIMRDNKNFGSTERICLHDLELIFRSHYKVEPKLGTDSVFVSYVKECYACARFTTYTKSGMRDHIRRFMEIPPRNSDETITTDDNN